MGFCLTSLGLLVLLAILYVYNLLWADEMAAGDDDTLAKEAFM